MINFDDTIKLVQEQDGTFNEGIQLEHGTELNIDGTTTNISTPVRFLLETEKQPLETGFTKILSNGQEVVVDEDRIVLDGIDVFDPYEITDNVYQNTFTGFLNTRSTKREVIKVSVEYDENSKT